MQNSAKQHHCSTMAKTIDTTQKLIPKAFSPLSDCKHPREKNNKHFPFVVVLLLKLDPPQNKNSH
jgi:hypothetical protein